jgi:MYXO-CTERM domain-containing protein
MCCFSSKTDVHGTSIFARLPRPGVQALVYQMRYTAERPTAMILPLPVALPAKEDAVRFTSLEAYPRFFDDLAAGFPEPPRRGRGLSRGVAAPEAAAAPLVVHDVGDFVATFVPSVNDFGRVDPRFALPRDAWARIPAYADYGFAVFQLKELAGSPHPIAFEFDTRSPGTLFFPTVHIHDGTVHEKDDFDHVLYAQEAAFDRHAGAYEGPSAVDAATGFVRSKETASSFASAERSRGLLDGSLLVHKTTLRGLLPNRDTTFGLGGAAAPQAAGCGRCGVGPGPAPHGASLPAMATLGALGWLLRRRHERRRGGA